MLMQCSRERSPVLRMCMEEGSNIIIQGSIGVTTTTTTTGTHNRGRSLLFSLELIILRQEVLPRVRL